MESVTLLNVRIDNITSQELLDYLTEGVLVTPNVDDVMKHQRDEEFHKMASSAEFSVCDSKIVKIFCALKGTPIKEAIPGSSFFPMFYNYHAKNEQCKIFLLGAKEGVAEKAKQNINEKIGREIVVGAYSPIWGFEKSEDECSKICELLSKSGANVVLVGLGNPKQTKFIYKYKSLVPSVKIWMALGATIDFEAGNVKRAPKIFQMFALEWLYRLLKEPRRLWRRYICDDLPFIFYWFKQVMGIYKDPFSK